MVFDIRSKETNTFMNHRRRTIYVAKQVKTRDCNIVSPKIFKNILRCI